MSFISLFMQALAINLPIRKIGNQNFYVYEVQKKENIYSVCNKLNITRADLVKYNPKAAEGIKSGDKLFFPVENSSSSADSPKAPQIIHKVQNDETLYGISKLYDVTPEQIVANNPEATAGVRNGDQIVIPQKEEKSDNNITVQVPADSVITYTIKQGETVADLIKLYDTSIESLFMLNPRVAPYEYTAGKTIKIKVGDNKHTDATQDAQFVSYIASKGETFSTISDKFNTPVEAIHQANPEIKAVKNKMKIYVPLIESNESVITPEGLPEDAYEVYDSIQDVIKSQQIDVALILPFMLSQQKLNKQALLYTEFYRGFLMALDSRSDVIASPINISVFDSSDSISLINDIIASDTIANAKYIIAPDNPEQLNAIAEYGNKINANVYNPFIVKNDLYLSNESVCQLNIPHELMIEKVISYLDNEFADTEIIFLSVGDLPEKDIIPTLRDALIRSHGDSHIQHLTMESFSSEDMSAAIETGKSYLIIPTNSSKSMVARINHGLKDLKVARQDVRMTLFGYPEWITYQNDYLDFFKNFNTVIYSRFYADESSVEYKEFVDKYKSEFNAELANAVPQLGILGYDLGNCIINDILTGDNSSYEGLQNILNFVESPNYKGLLNNAVFIIKFTPFAIERIVR